MYEIRANPYRIWPRLEQEPPISHWVSQLWATWAGIDWEFINLYSNRLLTRAKSTDGGTCNGKQIKKWACKGCEHMENDIEIRIDDNGGRDNGHRWMSLTVEWYGSTATCQQIDYRVNFPQSQKKWTIIRAPCAVITVIYRKNSLYHQYIRTHNRTTHISNDTSIRIMITITSIRT